MSPYFISWNARRLKAVNRPAALHRLKTESGPEFIMLLQEVSTWRRSAQPLSHLGHHFYRPPKCDCGISIPLRHRAQIRRTAYGRYWAGMVLDIILLISAHLLTGTPREKEKRETEMGTIDTFIKECKRDLNIDHAIIGGDFNCQLQEGVEGLTGEHAYDKEFDPRAPVVTDLMRKHQLKALNTWKPPQGRPPEAWTWTRTWGPADRPQIRQYDYILASGWKQHGMCWTIRSLQYSDHVPVIAMLPGK